MGRLQDRVAIITGASGGQGAATARLFAAEGAKVVIADLLDTEGQAVAKEIGSNAFFFHLDITKEANWNECVEETVHRWGGIDVLINNAGVVQAASILEMEASDFERVLKINVMGAWLGVKTAAPRMIEKGRGSIINISSTAGLWGWNGLAAYSSSKWALRGLTKSAAMELGHRGVRVNAIFPGGINTRMANSVSNRPIEQINANYTGQPIQRIGRPEEVAHASLFLASDEASYLCGSELAVDGGQTLGVYKSFMPGSPPA